MTTEEPRTDRQAAPRDAVALIRDIDLLSLLQALATGIPKVSKRFGGRAGLASKINSFMSALYAGAKWLLPCNNFDLSNRLSHRQLWAIFAVSYCATFVASFLAVAYLTHVQGRLWPDNDYCTINFFEDSTNVILYASIVPTYVGACIVLILISTSHWYAISVSTASDIQSAGGRLWRNVTSPVAVLAFCSVLTVLYVNDVFDATRIKAGSAVTCASQSNGEGPYRYYWFLTTAGQVNIAGYYYVILNFLLQLITVTAGLCFISVNVDAIKFINHWRESLFQKIPAEEVARQVKFLDTTYIIAKILAAVYLVNIFMWKGTPLGCLEHGQGDPGNCTVNVRFAELLMITVGLILVNFPRQYTVGIIEKHYRSVEHGDKEEQIRFLGIGDLITDREAYWKSYPGGRVAALALLVIDVYLFSTFLDAFIFADALRDFLYKIGVSKA